MTNGFETIPDARPDDEPWPDMVWPVAPDTTLAGDLVELSVVDPVRDGPELFAALDDDRVWTHLTSRPRSAQEYVDELGRLLAAGRLPWVVRLRRPLEGLPAGSPAGTSSYLEASVPDARLEVGSTAYAPSL